MIKSTMGYRGLIQAGFGDGEVASWIKRPPGGYSQDEQEDPQDIQRIKEDIQRMIQVK